MTSENTNEYNGYLSPKTKRKIQKRLDKWLNSNASSSYEGLQSRTPITLTFLNQINRNSFV